MFQAIFSSFLLVAACEMGDKTQLLAFSVAARFKKPWPIMGGIFVATILNHTLASYVGQWVSHVLRHNVLGYTLGASFIAFGFWTLKQDTLDAKEKTSNFGPFLTTAVLFFLTEMGDKTQLATLALGARYQSVLEVTLGSTMGMMVADGLAVFLGGKLSGKTHIKGIRWVAAGLFFVFGLFSLSRAIITGS